MGYLQNSEEFLINSDAIRIRHISLSHIKNSYLKCSPTFWNRHSAKKPTYIIYVHLFPSSLPFPIYIPPSKWVRCLLTWHTETKCDRSGQDKNYIFQVRYFWFQIPAWLHSIYLLCASVSQCLKQPSNGLFMGWGWRCIWKIDVKYGSFHIFCSCSFLRYYKWPHTLYLLM